MCPMVPLLWKAQYRCDITYLYLQVVVKVRLGVVKENSGWSYYANLFS